ncbi:MAG: hypothetical protein KF805_13235 [Phycisphaeraceae bacterium]|nr:hypothetical protein [Phycisphaeraceae bacterium]
MVAHNTNYKTAVSSIPTTPPSPRNSRYGEPKDQVSPLHENDLICELADPSNSLDEICAAMRISLEALSLWMARPDVAARLDLMQSAAMNRARFIGRLTLPTAAQSAANIINAHKLRPQKPTIDSAFDSSLHRANETMLKAARFLQRLTPDPDTRRARKSKTSPPMQEANEPARSDVAHPAEIQSGHAIPKPAPATNALSSQPEQSLPREPDSQVIRQRESSNIPPRAAHKRSTPSRTRPASPGFPSAHARPTSTTEPPQSRKRAPSELSVLKSAP